jgi:hypothetical protein
MAVTINDIQTTGTATLKAEGYAGNLFGTRLNGNGSTSFVWSLSKDGKNYLMENNVHLGNVDAKDLSVFAEVFKGDLKNAVEIKP